MTQKIDKNTPELNHALKNALHYLNIEINDVEYDIQKDKQMFDEKFINESNKKIGKCEMLMTMIESMLNEK